MKKVLLSIMMSGLAFSAHAQCPQGQVIGAKSGECIASSGTWDNGSKGSGTWTMTADGTLTVSGTGVLKDVGLDGKNAPWPKADIQNFVVTEGITAVNNLGLSDIGKVNITLADSIQTIGDYAFYHANTDNIVLPNNLKEIGWIALHCHYAGRVVIPESVEKLDSSAWTSSRPMTMYCPPKWLDKCRGGGIKSFAYEKVGNEYIVYNKDGSIKASFKSWNDLAEDKLFANYTKNSDGSYTLTDVNGKFIGYKNKRIYTVNEAASIVSPKGNTFTLRYK